MQGRREDAQGRRETTTPRGDEARTSTDTRPGRTEGARSATDPRPARTGPLHAGVHGRADTSRGTGAETEAVTPDGWQALRALTDARIALGHCGVSLPTAPLLDFQLAHARARDAVHHALDIASMAETLVPLGLPVLPLASRAESRADYLRRPDLGRRLDEASVALLQARRQSGRPDVVFVIGDGLSSVAIERNARPLLTPLLPMLAQAGWQVGPLTIVRHARVAVGDEIGHALRAAMVVVLIGERPGLSSPDSLGIYLTWAPRPGLTDAARNCISNVRPAGLPHAAAADRLFYLMTEARRRGLSGVALKDESSTRLVGEARTGLPGPD